MEPFWNREHLQQFIEAAVQQYGRGPAWLVNWLEDLYLRLQEDLRRISLYELEMLSRLHDAAGWLPEPLAVNMIYKMFSHLGWDTTGIIDH